MHYISNFDWKYTFIQLAHSHSCTWPQYYCDHQSVSYINQDKLDWSETATVHDWQTHPCNSPAAVQTGFSWLVRQMQKTLQAILAIQGRNTSTHKEICRYEDVLPRDDQLWNEQRRQNIYSHKVASQNPVCRSNNTLQHPFFGTTDWWFDCV